MNNPRVRATRRTLAALATLAAGTSLALTTVRATAATPTTATAPADGTPRFLEPTELPQRLAPWHAGEVTAGQPFPSMMCVGEALPSIASYRVYGTEFDTNVLQVTVVERDERRAKAFAALLRKDLADCSRKVMEQRPDMTATQKYYGRLNVEEGADVYGIHTETQSGTSNIDLFSVGRDGRTVTVLEWGQPGTFQDAPVADFKTTTVTAVNKLY